MSYDFEKMTDEELIGFLRDQADKPAEDDELSADAESLLAAAKTAADRGSAEAQYYYGGFLLRSKGTERNEEIAGEYLRQSAAQDYPPAINQMGICYQAGACGFEKNHEKAAECYTRAAGLGSTDSMVHLYGMYMSGTGVEKNRQKALGFLREAAEKDFTPACVLLGMDILNDPGIPSGEKQEGARFLLRAAELDDPVGQLMYAACCENGIGVEKDLSEASGWYRRAAKAGNRHANDALIRLGFPGVM